MILYKTNLYLNNNMKISSKLGQYFTTNNDLKNKVLKLIKNNPDIILEPSVGQGDLVQVIYNNNNQIVYLTPYNHLPSCNIL